MKNRNLSLSGFSLVEVTLALGVVVFCLVTILGLLAVGINSTHVSTAQTAATNILTAVASDVEATPNVTQSYVGGPPTFLPAAKGKVQETSKIYGIVLPAGLAGASTSATIATGATTGPTTIYIGENGQVTTVASALYRLSVWVTTSGTFTATPTNSVRQETFVRLLITWPASVSYTSAPNYVENVIAVNRT